MILEEGDKVLIVHRRLFESDGDRFFIGLVEGYESGMAKVSGFSWVKDQLGGLFVRKSDPRTKVVSLLSGTLIVYQLPAECDPSSLRIECDHQGKNLLKGPEGFQMDLSEREHGPSRRQGM